jgi:quinol monooxygenase YgiN
LIYDADVLFVFVRLHAHPGHEADVEAAILRVVDASRREPGCVGMDAFRSVRASQLFYIHSKWIDEAAFDHHATLAHTRQFIEEVDAMLDERREVTRTSRIA